MIFVYLGSGGSLYSNPIALVSGEIEKEVRPKGRLHQMQLMPFATHLQGIYHTSCRNNIGKQPICQYL